MGQGLVSCTANGRRPLCIFQLQLPRQEDACPLPLLVCIACRVLYGDMHVCSYDWAEPGDADAVELPRAARRVVDSTLTAADQPTVLFPDAGGNIHEFTALTDCAVLDLMSPPYSTGQLIGKLWLAGL